MQGVSVNRITRDEGKGQTTQEGSSPSSISNSPLIHQVKEDYLPSWKDKVLRECQAVHKTPKTIHRAATQHNSDDNSGAKWPECSPWRGCVWVSQKGIPEHESRFHQGSERNWRPSDGTTKWVRDRAVLPTHASYRTPKLMPYLQWWQWRHSRAWRHLPSLGDPHITKSFPKTLDVIDHSFLDTRPSGSFGTVRTFLLNLISLAVRLTLEARFLKISEKDTAAYIYQMDAQTDFDEWVAPFHPLLGPAGGRRSRKEVAPPKRTFRFIDEDGNVMSVNIGKWRRKACIYHNRWAWIMLLIC